MFFAGKMSRNLAGFSNDSLFAGSPNGQQAIEREELYGEDKLQQMEEQKIDAYVPDSHLAHELNRGRRVRGQPHRLETWLVRVGLY